MFFVKLSEFRFVFKVWTRHDNTRSQARLSAIVSTEVGWENSYDGSQLLRNFLVIEILNQDEGVLISIELYHQRQ